ncbi:MAG: carbon monoxide dehydrogenase subunit G [Candidatus Latescibacteria bacterium]|nr:carbon monoxide dehydrogenase subunit G [Candidatus Latescibacterota bacterium]
MKIEGTVTLHAPRERVWHVLTTPEILIRCMPGCEKLEEVGDGEYEIVLTVGVAAIKGMYAGKVKLSGLIPPDHYRIDVDGKGKTGFVKGGGTIDLKDGEEGTLLTYVGDVAVGGTIASVGQRMIQGVAKLMVGQFFTALEAEAQAEEGTTPKQGIAVNLLRSIKKKIDS